MAQWSQIWNDKSLTRAQRAAAVAQERGRLPSERSPDWSPRIARPNWSVQRSRAGYGRD